MEKLVSCGLSRGDVVPEAYIFPDEERATTVNPCESIPVIDLEGGSEDEVAKEIIEAGKKFGFFQVINHAIPQEMIDNVMEVGQQFFEMPAEDKAPYYSEDPRKQTRLYTGQGYGKQNSLFWRDCLLVMADPLDKFQHLLPQKPANFRNAVSKFAPEAKVLVARILKLISMGLGLEEDYMTGDRSGGPLRMGFNCYPRCPNPDLTFGLPKHCDPTLISMIIQGEVSGLQVLHEGQWIFVDPLPNAFVLNFGLLMEVITNGVLKAVEHRVVTNNTVSRLSIGLPIVPAVDCIICPAEAFVNMKNPPLHGSFSFSEFFKIFSTKNTEEKDLILEHFRIKS